MFSLTEDCAAVHPFCEAFACCLLVVGRCMVKVAIDFAYIQVHRAAMSKPTTSESSCLRPVGWRELRGRSTITSLVLCVERKYIHSFRVFTRFRFRWTYGNCLRSAAVERSCVPCRYQIDSATPVQAWACGRAIHERVCTQTIVSIVVELSMPQHSVLSTQDLFEQAWTSRD